jgi:hypothetical protein
VPVELRVTVDVPLTNVEVVANPLLMADTVTTPVEELIDRPVPILIPPKVLDVAIDIEELITPSFAIDIFAPPALTPPSTKLVAVVIREGKGGLNVNTLVAELYSSELSPVAVNVVTVNKFVITVVAVLIMLVANTE